MSGDGILADHLLRDQTLAITASLSITITTQFCHRLSDVSSLKLTTGARLIVCSYLATRLLKAISVYRKSGQICDQLGISFLDHLPSDFFSSSKAINTSLSLGNPLVRHWLTAGGLTRQSLATANVPPNVWMISVVFMLAILTLFVNKLSIRENTYKINVDCLDLIV